MCDTCAKYTNMNGIRGVPSGQANIVGVRSSGSNRRVSSSVRRYLLNSRSNKYIYNIKRLVEQIYCMRFIRKVMFSVFYIECK